MGNRTRTKPHQKGTHLVYKFQSSNDVGSCTFGFVRLATFGEDQDRFLGLGFRLPRPGQTTLWYRRPFRHSGLDHEFHGRIGTGYFDRLRGT